MSRQTCQKLGIDPELADEEIALKNPETGEKFWYGAPGLADIPEYFILISESLIDAYHLGTAMIEVGREKAPSLHQIIHLPEEATPAH